MATAGDCKDDAALLASLKACAKQKDLHTGSRLHASILKRGLLTKNIYLGNTLVHMYAKCGALTKAQQVFDELPVRDIVSWNALIAGYAQHGHGQEALDCFEGIYRDGLSPNAVTFACVLKACGSTGASKKGKKIHDEIMRECLLGKDVVLGNALVDMYAKCGELARAQQMFDEMPVWNVVSWTALIAGYVQHGHSEEALQCFGCMQREGFSPDAVTFACTLKACGSIGALEKGKQIHSEILREGLLGKNSVLDAALVDMYAKCGALAKAQQLLDELPVHHMLSWTALIAGYCQHGKGEEALNCFERMLYEGHSLDAVCFLCLLKACGSIGAAEKGAKIHAEIVKEGLLKKCGALGNALVDMYAQCGALSKAQQLFDELSARDLVSWTALIAGYAQHGQGEEALKCFKRMQAEGLSPDVVTFLCILKVCGSIRATEKGKEIHAEILKEGLLGKDSALGSALVDMYVKCGAIAKAQQVLDELLVRDAVAWTALIAGYAQHGYGEEALNCYVRMQVEGFSPDIVTFLCILKACGSIGAAEKGEELYAEIVKEGLLEEDSILGNALVDMYAKCGALAKAQQVFDKLPIRAVVSWNALLTGHAHLGNYEDAFELFSKMVEEGVEPDSVTFTIVLNACSQSGLVDEGKMYFETMTTICGFVPTLEQYTCMVNLFACAGHFDKAMLAVKKVSSSAYSPLWFSLLGACRKWGNEKLGRLAFEHLVQLD